MKEKVNNQVLFDKVDPHSGVKEVIKVHVMQILFPIVSAFLFNRKAVPVSS